jgi:hypothetical protein
MSLVSENLAEYNAWVSARYRCTIDKHPQWSNYGGRGIDMCQRWRESFAAFLSDMGPRPSPVHQLDRIDNDGHYEPGNCRWVTRQENLKNKGRYIRKQPSMADQARLARLSNIDDRYHRRMGKESDRLKREMDAKKSRIIERIRPEFRPIRDINANMPPEPQNRAHIRIRRWQDRF